LGETQERAAIHGYLIKPGKNTNIAVRCIHASKGIVGGSEMSYGGVVPYYVDLSNQAKTWNSIDCSGTNELVSGFTTTNSTEWTSMTTTDINCDYCFSSNSIATPENGTYFVQTDSFVPLDDEIASSDDLVSTIETMADNIKDAMKNIPYIENQVGGIFLNGSGEILGLDIYNIPISWQSVKNDIIKKEGASFIDDEDDLFVMRPEKVAKVISKNLKRDFTEKVIYSGEYTISEIRYENLVGEVVFYNNKIIHLTLWGV